MLCRRKIFLDAELCTRSNEGRSLYREDTL